MNIPPKTCIFVACHKQSFIPDNPLLYPVQVGAALADKRLKGMQPDDEGDSISSRNPDYCELTAQYWAWKNADCDYYGFFHYRRYLAFDKVSEVGSNGKLSGKRLVPYIELDNVWDDLSAYGLDADTMQAEIRKYDILTVYRERIDTSVYKQYCQYHGKAGIDKVLELLKTRHPEYSEAADMYMASHDVYYMNMYIMRRDMFNEYMSWLFDILEAFEAELICGRADIHIVKAGNEADSDKNNYHIRHGAEDCGNDDLCGNTPSGNIPYEGIKQSTMYEPRIMGFLAERLFGIFYTYKIRSGAKCAELRYIRFYNTDPEAAHTVSDLRSFNIGPLHVRVNMRTLNRLCPAGTRRRMLLRGLFIK